MGCCSCRPDSDTVLNDPFVTLGARVGGIAFISENYVFTNTGIGGLMYIIEDMLYYEAICCGRLCCLSCRKAFKVTDITRVEVVENRIERVSGNSHIYLHPGLKITVKPQSTPDTLRIVVAMPDTTIIVAMPDATEFAARLGQVISPQSSY